MNGKQLPLFSLEGDYYVCYKNPLSVYDRNAWGSRIFRRRRSWTHRFALVGDVVRQGDLYLIAIESLPNGKKTNERQLVPGTTQGSRHVVEGNVEIVNEVQFKDIPAVLVGPAFKCNSETTVTHPEHGDKILPADTVWQCVYQQAYADEIRRVQD